MLPIWHLEPSRALFVGPLARNAPHAHSVPVFLAGVVQPFRLRLAGSAWMSCRTAVIPAGVPYEFDVAGAPLAVLYLEPGAGGAGTLAPLAGAAAEVGGALVGRRGVTAPLRELFEARSGTYEAGAALDDLLAYARPKARRRIDPRIARAVQRLAEATEDAVAAADAARAVGLSSSRFQHLFAREVGVPFRRFRTWQRLRAAIAEITAGASFTAAAHAAGFADQAHFAHAFRRTFGAPASPSLARVRRA